MSRFDVNRDLQQDDRAMQEKIAELEAVLRLQEQKILQQQQQLQEQQLQMQQQLQEQQQEQIQQQQLEQAQQEQQQRQQLQELNLQQTQQQQLPPQQYPLNDEFGFNMTAKDVIEQFRRLKPLDERHSPRAFIHAVEANLALCRNNETLAQFCIRIVANEKVLGNAGKRVRELPNNASWEEIKARILQEYRPRRTYAEIFNYCRTIKVRNLNELFNIFEKAKFEINDIYLGDQFKPTIYRPENVDRDLVDILLEKIDGPIRAHIGEHETLTDIILKYTRLKLLDDTRAIAFNHRTKGYNQGVSIINKNQNHQIRQNYRTKNYNNLSSQNSNRTRQTYHANNQNIFSSEHTNRNYETRHNYQPTNYNNLTTQTSNRRQSHENRQEYNPNKDRYSNQTRTSRTDSRNNQSTDEPMEIGNLYRENEINFLMQPQNQHCP